jgi:hypothetical protein
MYSLEFAKRLLEAAESFDVVKNDKDEVGRAILYLSLLSCEITLKALLEKAGFSVRELTKRSHDLRGLCKDICSCELTGPGFANSKPHSAASMLAKVVVKGTTNGTVGTLLSAENANASKFPNEIRYGELIKHFHPLDMLNCANIVAEWAAQNFNYIKRKDQK